MFFIAQRTKEAGLKIQFGWRCFDRFPNDKRHLLTGVTISVSRHINLNVPGPTFIEVSADIQNFGLFD